MNTVIRIVATLLLAGYANAQSIRIPIPFHALAHPVATVKATSPETLFLFASDVSLELANAGDFLTTYAGPITHPARYCEGNPLLTIGTCSIDAHRFELVKLGVAAFGVVQWVPIWAGWHSPKYILYTGVADTTVAAILTKIDAGNTSALRAK